jgi:ketosteroid isomerase-like protein
MRNFQRLPNGIGQDVTTTEADVEQMDIEARKKRACAVLRATETADKPTLTSLFTGDARLWVPQSATSRAGLDRPVVGADAIAALFTASPHFNEMRWTIQQCVGEGDYVAVQTDMTGSTATGNAYQSSHLWLFRFEGERVAEAWEYADTAYAFERMGV